LYQFLFCSIHATLPAHIIHLNLTILTLSVEYKLRRSSLCNCLHPHVTSCSVPRSQTHVVNITICTTAFCPHSIFVCSIWFSQ
jgi:hypothetical protein